MLELLGYISFIFLLSIGAVIIATGAILKFICVLFFKLVLFMFEKDVDND